MRLGTENRRQTLAAADADGRSAFLVCGFRAAVIVPERPGCRQSVNSR
jgi:hypothetical protein